MATMPLDAMSNGSSDQTHQAARKAAQIAIGKPQRPADAPGVFRRIVTKMVRLPDETNAELDSQGEAVAHGIAYLATHVKSLSPPAKRKLDEQVEALKARHAPHSAYFAAIFAAKPSAPTPDGERTRMELLGATRLREIVAGQEMLSIRATAELLGKTVADVEALLRANRILGLTADQDSSPVFPRWQFDDAKVLPQVERILGALRHEGPWAQHRFFVVSARELGGRAPKDCLREAAMAEQLVDLAQIYGEQRPG